jgi:hypothetical protein
LRAKPDLSAPSWLSCGANSSASASPRLSEIVKDVPAIYARYLTVEDMRTLTAFYSTPTGARLLQVLPKILPEGFATVLPRMQTMAGETQESFLKLLRERGLLN